MAVIGSIRKRGTLILVIVGISMLAFILGDRLFVGLINPAPDNSIARINGKKVDPNEYLSKVETYGTRWQQQNPGNSPGEKETQEFRDKGWNDIIRQYLLAPEFAKLGLRITKEELNDMQAGVTADEQIRRLFTDPQTGQFDRQQLVKVIEQLSQDVSSVPENQQQMFLAQKSYYASLLNDIQGGRLVQKYTALVKNGAYVTTKEAERIFKEQNDRANIRVVAKSYIAIPDSTVEVSDAELKKFYAENKYKFHGRRSRQMSLVLFNFNPSAADTAAIYDQALSLVAEFDSTDNDTTFVQLNSDGFSIPQLYRSNAMIPAFDTTLFNAAPGTIVGPVRDNKFFAVAKKLQDTLISDSSRVYHILIKVSEARNDSAAKQITDSIMNVIKTGGDFYALAGQLSEDDGSAIDSGKIGWVAQGMNYVPEFIDSSLAGKAGDVVITRSQFGYHLIKVAERSPYRKQVLVAQFMKEIRPSEATRQQAQVKATEFSGMVNVKEKGFDSGNYFKQKGKEMGVSVFEAQEIRDETRTLNLVQEPIELIKWATNAKRNEISSPFESGYNLVVATVTSIRDYGIPPLEDIKAEVRKEALKHKKAEMLKEEFTAAMASAKDLDGVASIMKLQVMSAPDVTLQYANISGYGQEPQIAGSAFGSQPGKMYGPVEGERGVYMYILDAINAAPAPPDIAAFKNQQIETQKGAVLNGIFYALTTKTKFADHRLRFE